jgi:hypothetical protein
MGNLFVNGLLNGESDLWLASNTNVVINYGDEGNGAYLNEIAPQNQIAVMGNLPYGRVGVPTSSLGQAGDVTFMVADDANYHYYCTANYDGTTHIWKRVAWTAGTWGV